MQMIIIIIIIKIIITTHSKDLFKISIQSVLNNECENGEYWPGKEALGVKGEGGEGRSGIKTPLSSSPHPLPWLA